MDGDRDGTQVRLAELVAALSLGIDLGFGQPMEHVLRQCLIALRMAERLGLDEQTRAAVYYTALLVNVGCHTDAHEQAKWFGDDIALKATKYDHPPHSVRAAVSGLRRLGAGNPPLHRFRVGLTFAVSGRREVENMISEHAAIARTFAEQLGLSGEVLDGIAASYEYWVELEFERDVVAPPEFESTDAAIEFLASKFGPMMMARQLTEASGRWPELRAELTALYERDEPAEYLLTLGQKAQR